VNGGWQIVLLHPSTEAKLVTESPHTSLNRRTRARFSPAFLSFFSSFYAGKTVNSSPRQAMPE
jgi:hypothetical protein